MIKNSTKAIEKEFDVVNFIKLQKKVRILQDILLDAHESSLFYLNRRFVADVDPDSDSDLNLDKLLSVVSSSQKYSNEKNNKMC